MKRLLWNALFVVTMVSRCCEAIDLQKPFPQGQISSEVLSQFYPMIMEEIEKEFSHQNTSHTHRDTREYGYSYFKMEEGDFSYLPPPEFLSMLGKEVCQALGHPTEEFTNIILSLYEEGFHLRPHVDTHVAANTKGYYYDENVYGIIIEADPTGHLYFVRDEVNPMPPLDLAPIYNLEETTGSIFCLKGDFRMPPYFHGVSGVSKRRISITFRKVIIDAEKK